MSINYSFVVFIFSFNRGEFLYNCITSVEKSIDDIKIVIFDDNSDDPQTLRVLERASRHHEVIKNSRLDEFEKKTGGLAGSMNMAMQYALDRHYEYAVFVQDDMQFVRRIFDTDFRDLIAYFENVKNSIQISTNFVRKLSYDNINNEFYIDKNSKSYLKKEGAGRGKSNFSDTGVFSVSRFFELFERFEIGEDVNNAKAKSRGLACGLAIYPFMCWLPYPPSYRGKKKDWRHRIFEYFGRSGYYPIKRMSASDVSEFIHRDPSVIPVMEEFLEAPNVPRKDVWSTGGGEYNFICYGSLLAKTFVFLQSLKRKLKK